MAVSVERERVVVFKFRESGFQSLIDEVYEYAAEYQQRWGADIDSPTLEVTDQEYRMSFPRREFDPEHVNFEG